MTRVARTLARLNTDCGNEEGPNNRAINDTCGLTSCTLDNRVRYIIKILLAQSSPMEVFFEFVYVRSIAKSKVERFAILLG